MPNDCKNTPVNAEKHPFGQKDFFQKVSFILLFHTHNITKKVNKKLIQVKITVKPLTAWNYCVAKNAVRYCIKAILVLWALPLLVKSLYKTQEILVERHVQERNNRPEVFPVSHACREG